MTGSKKVERKTAERKTRWLRLCNGDGSVALEDKTRASTEAPAPAILSYDGKVFEHRTFDGTWHVYFETTYMNLDE